MDSFSYKGKTYSTDSNGFLLDYTQWDENFVEGVAGKIGIQKLTRKHWEVIRFIREWFGRTGECPLVYKVCRESGLSSRGLKELFPTGWLRGACKLAGINYKDRFVNYYGEEVHVPGIAIRGNKTERIYRVNGKGFLVDPAEWNKEFAIHKACEIKIGKLGPEHWKIIDYLRGEYLKNGSVPTIYETCEANGIEIEDLERLFPEGYHRGAVKVAGLRAA